MHVLPKGFHRIRHYGLFANGNRAANIARLRELFHVPPAVEAAEAEATTDDQSQMPCRCPRCGGRMIIIETFPPGMLQISWPAPTGSIDCDLVDTAPCKAIHLACWSPTERPGHPISGRFGPT